MSKAFWTNGYLDQRRVRSKSSKWGLYACSSIRPSRSHCTYAAVHFDQIFGCPPSPLRHKLLLGRLSSDCDQVRRPETEDQSPQSTPFQSNPLRPHSLFEFARCQQRKQLIKVATIPPRTRHGAMPCLTLHPPVQDPWNYLSASRPSTL